MTQFDAWEREYLNPKLLTRENEPQKDTVRFVRWLKDQGLINFSNILMIDLGAGTGRNTNYFAELGADAKGIELSKTAVMLAKKDALARNLKTDFVQGSMGEPYPPDIKTDTVDIVIDVTSSNSLTEKEREVYLSETYRVLKSKKSSTDTTGYFFVKALCKDGDHNAKELIKKSPGKEKDTYIIKELGIHERVFSKEDFTATYSTCFDILFLEKKTTYTRFNNRSFKRNFWIAYMQKK